MASYFRLFMQNLPQNSDALDELYKGEEQVNELKHLAEPEFSSSGEVLENDMENYLRWKMMGGAIRLKSGIVPHIFDCQRLTTVKPRRNASIKRHNMSLVQEALNTPQPSASTTAPDMEWVDCGSPNIEINPIDNSESGSLPGENHLHHYNVKPEPSSPSHIDHRSSTVILPSLEWKRQESQEISPSTGEDDDSIVSTVILPPRALKRKRQESGKRSPLVRVKRDPDSIDEDVNSIVSTVRSPSLVRVKRDPDSRDEDKDSIVSTVILPPKASKWKGQDSRERSPSLVLVKRDPDSSEQPLTSWNSEFSTKQDSTRQQNPESKEFDSVLQKIRERRVDDEKNIKKLNNADQDRLLRMKKQKRRGLMLLKPKRDKKKKKKEEKNNPFMPIHYQDNTTPVQGAAADVELDSDDDEEPRDFIGAPTFDELRLMLPSNEGSDFGEDVEEDEEQQQNTGDGAGTRSRVASNYMADFPETAIPEDVDAVRALDSRDDLYLRNLTTDKLEFDWQQDPNVFQGTEEVFTGRAGPMFQLDDDITPLAILEKIWDSDILQLIVEQTNLYAEQFLKKPGVKLNSRIKKWKPVTANDIWLFFAVLILQSLDSRGDETEYWYSNLEYLDMPNFKKVMPYAKYVLIKKYLHFVNNETLTGKFKKAAKIKPVIDYLNKKFESLYLPAQEIALDESLLRKGRLNMVQKISNIAAGVGLKTYELCDSKTGYLWSFRLYTGKDDKPSNEDEAGLIEHSSNEPEPDPNDPTETNEPDSQTSAIVFDLVCPLLGKGHVLYMDNFYNSPLLSRLLKLQNTDTVGTLRNNREFFPEELKKTEKSELRVGEIAFSATSDITVILWRDANLIALISTMHPIKIGGREKCGKNIYKPQVVLDYNLHMGGVDKKDQLLSAFPMERSRNMYWYKKFFRRLVNTSILNAWIIMNTKQKMAHRAFREQLVRLIVAKTQPSVSTVVNQNPKGKRPQLVGGHYSVKGTKKRAVCKLCSMRGIPDKRTSRMCDVCEVPLCLDPCFKEYHTKVLR